MGERAEALFRALTTMRRVHGVATGQLPCMCAVCEAADEARALAAEGEAGAGVQAAIEKWARECDCLCAACGDLCEAASDKSKPFDLEKGATPPAAEVEPPTEKCGACYGVGYHGPPRGAKAPCSFCGGTGKRP